MATMLCVGSLKGIPAPEQPLPLPIQTIFRIIMTSSHHQKQMADVAYQDYQGPYQNVIKHSSGADESITGHTKNINPPTHFTLTIHLLSHSFFIIVMP